MARRAVFIDREGALAAAGERPPRLLHGACEAVLAINRAGWQAVLISHQPGLAFGEIDEESLAEDHESLRLALLAENARLDGIYHCPHHPEATVKRYRTGCECRIPSTGLLTRAREEMGVDLSSSYVIGDTLETLQLAHAAGLRSVLLRSKRGRQIERRLPHGEVCAGAIVDDLAQALDWIFRHAGVQLEEIR